MKKIWLCMVLWAISMLPAIAQVKIYKTFADYEAGSGDEYDDFNSYSYAGGKVKLSFIKAGKKTGIACGDMWGFTYKEVLFRIDKRYAQPTRVMSIGKICYYENGIAHLKMLRDNTNTGDFSIGYYSYVSSGIDTEMYQLPVGISDGREALKNFRKAHPEYDSLFECWNDGKGDMRECIKDFEAEE